MTRGSFELSPRKRALLEKLRRQEGLPASGTAWLRRRPRDGPIPLSFAQERLWFLDRLEPGTPMYNIPQAARLKGPVRPDLLAKALTQIVARHEILRTTFASVEGRPTQVVAPAAPVVHPGGRSHGTPG